MVPEGQNVGMDGRNGRTDDAKNYIPPTMRR